MTTDPGSMPAPHLRLEQFLDDVAVTRLREFVLERRDEFRPSGVTTVRADERPDDVRRSRTLDDCEPVWPLFETALTSLLPIVRKELRVGHFPLDRVERQLTAHFDGDFFGPHNDSGGPHVATRQVTYVYYFNFDPKQFSGGELRLYGSVDHDGVREQGEDYVTIEPVHNSIVFFPSWVHHEVRPVRTATSALESARMTLNGWYHQPRSTASDLDELTEWQRTSLPRFTASGFEVRPTPPHVHDALVRAYESSIDAARPEAPDPRVLPTGEPDLVPIGEIGAWLGDELRPVHEAWAGRPLRHTATYGIRIYRHGQTLERHCDRAESHVVSSIVHLDHDGEPWPLSIEDHAGQRHDVVLGPGEMLLYESATCPHARPLPFRGSRYSSVFVHYRPVEGWPSDGNAASTVPDR